MSQNLIIANGPYHLVQKPNEIIQELNKFVIGQESAKEELAILVYKGFIRLVNNTINQNPRKILKSNLLMFGSTATGKSYLLKKLGDVCKIPVLTIDSTSLTASGYVGTSLSESMLAYNQVVEESFKRNKQHLQERIDFLGEDMHSSVGIIFLDEFDKKKLSSRDKASSDNQDVGTGRIQQEVLKVIEGTNMKIQHNPSGSMSGGRTVEIDTTDISFVLGGAFTGIDNIVNQRLGNTTMGLKPQNPPKLEEIYSLINTDDLQKFGFISELVGRVHNRVGLNKLDKDQLFKILKFSQESPVYDNFLTLGQIGCKLEFEDDALQEIANRAFDLDLGARGLKTLLDKITKPLYLDTQSHHVVTAGEVIKVTT